MATSPYVIEYEGAFHLDLPPERVWAIISRTERYEGWWGWLREFETEGRDLETGSVLRGVVVPPLPYRMRLEVVLAQSSRPRRIDAVVSGDLRGDATLRLAPDGEGTEATVSWTIEMMQRPMRLAARLAHPLLRWGHDLVVQATVEGFRRILVAEASSLEGSGGSGGSTGLEASEGPPTSRVSETGEPGSD
jgi:carbon monoxide dehydrogenase subunit G